MAILLDFYLVLRIGELKGLKWSDISNGYIHISRFVNDKNEVVNEIKGHTSEGIRTMPLTPGAQAVLRKFIDCILTAATISSFVMENLWQLLHLIGI